MRLKFKAKFKSIFSEKSSHKLCNSFYQITNFLPHSYLVSGMQKAKSQKYFLSFLCGFSRPSIVENFQMWAQQCDKTWKLFPMNIFYNLFCLFLLLSFFFVFDIHKFWNVWEFKSNFMRVLWIFIFLHLQRSSIVWKLWIAKRPYLWSKVCLHLFKAKCVEECKERTI